MDVTMKTVTWKPTQETIELAEQVRILTLGNALLRGSLKAVCEELEERIMDAYHRGLIAREQYERDMTFVAMARLPLGEKAPQQRG
jgi:hypothetical protein